MRALEDQPPEGPDRPPVEFWENTLEFPVTRLLEDAESPEFMNDWIRQRRARQVATLRHLLGLPVDAPLRERKAQLKDRQRELTRFVPAALFAVRKSMHATLDVAVGCLDEATIRLAQESDGSYDTTALIFGILDRSWRDLEKVFHLDKLHKVGFARMRVPKPPRRPARQVQGFSCWWRTPCGARAVRCRPARPAYEPVPTGHRVRDAQVVFIRRPHQQRYVLAEDRVVHGFSPDQIVLDFRDEAARLNIASHDHAASYEIANRLASAFYGQDCEYENITEEAFAAQIARFLRTLRDDEARDLMLVEMRLRESPLYGTPDLDLSKQGQSLARACARGVGAGATLDDRGPRPHPRLQGALQRQAGGDGDRADRGWLRRRAQVRPTVSGPVIEPRRAAGLRGPHRARSRDQGCLDREARCARSQNAGCLGSLLRHGARFLSPDVRLLEQAERLVQPRSDQAGARADRAVRLTAGRRLSAANSQLRRADRPAPGRRRGWWSVPMSALRADRIPRGRREAGVRESCRAPEPGRNRSLPD